MNTTEAKRIGSFPDGYHFVGNNRQIINRIGNSVPPLFMREIARHIRATILNHATLEATGETFDTLTAARSPSAASASSSAESLDS